MKVSLQHLLTRHVMEDLFGSKNTIGMSDIEQLSDVSIEFKCWALQALMKGKLDTFMGAVLHTRRATTPCDALRYLADVSSARSTNVSVTQLDFKGLKGQALQRLIKLVNGSSGNDDEFSSNALYRFHGIVGHVAIPSLFMREEMRALRYQPRSRTRMNQYVFDFAQKEIPGVQIEFFEGDNAWYDDNVARVPPMGKQFIDGLSKHWEKMAKEMRGANLQFEQYYRLKELMPRLRSYLLPLFGTHMRYLVARGSSHVEYLFQLTLMSWASAALYAYDAGTRVLFRELPVLSSLHGVNGGRVDALEVSLIDGAPPNKTSMTQLAELARRERMEGASVGKVLFDIEQLFGGKHVEVNILDWKFAVGDAQRDCEILTDVKEPIDRHVQQMQRYLTFGALDYHFATLRRGSGLKEWARNQHLQNGKLIYFLPSEHAREHIISLSTQEREMVFARQVALRWNTAEGRARTRTLENDLVGHIRGLLKYKNGNGNNGNKSHVWMFKTNGTSNTSQIQLFEDVERPSVRRIIEAHRQFADKLRIIEIIGEIFPGEPRYALHIGNLAKALTEGTVKAQRGFDWIRGGKVTCPVHPDEDKNPSLHVYPERRFAKCFSCGAFARFNEWSVPPTLSLPTVMVGSSAMPRGMQSLEISPEHHRIMSLVRVALSLRFRGSEGERYLVETRLLSSDSASDRDVGYWDDEVVVSDILDMGISFENLIYYGFLGFSDRIREDSRLISVLKRHGFSQSSIERPVHGQDGREISGRPYSILGDRVTFPLTIAGKMTSFYGRDVCGRGKAFTHRKLLTSHTNVPHGVFNEYPLSTKEQDEVVLVEAPIDALTLLEMGYHDVVSLVGIKNYVILELIARTGKRIAVALDNDKAGINNTYGYEQEMKGANGKASTRHIVGVIEWFGNNGLEGKVRDFTKTFREEHLADEGWKDWNDWWKQFGPNRKETEVMF